MIMYGVCDAIFSISSSPLIKAVGRIPIFTLGALINAGLITTMLIWMPTPDQYLIFYIIAGLWGISDAIWQTQINGKLKLFESCILQ